MILVVSVTACSSSKGETVATVEGTKISSDEFKKTIALYKDSMEQTYRKDVQGKITCKFKKGCFKFEKSNNIGNNYDFGSICDCLQF